MRAVLRFSWVYLATLVVTSLALAIVASATTYGDRTGVGCNLYDSLFFGVDCRGFPGAGLAQVFLGFPLLVAQVSALAWMSPWMLAPAVLLWAPALLLVYRWVRRR